MTGEGAPFPPGEGHGRPDFPGAPPPAQVLTVRQLNERISAALAASFAATVWVRGEVQRLPADAARRTHVYFELHETGESGAAEYQIPAALMGWDRDRYGLGRYLDGTDPDLQIADRMEVCFECKVDFYAKFGKLSLKIVGVDKHYSLGRLEARRRRTLAYLAEAGLLARQGALALPALPLRVGLITAADSAAERDFLSGLQASGRPFAVSRVGAKMQGEQMQAQVVRALERLAAARVQVIVITRGGGSRADLSWFDQQDLAEAIARCPVPVITAIGHEIDRAIADVVAHRACKTPTAAAEFLVGVVEEAAGRLERAAAALAELAAARLDAAVARADLGGRVARAVTALLAARALRTRALGTDLLGRAALRLAQARDELAEVRLRLAAAAAAVCARRRESLAPLGPRLAAAARGPLRDGARRGEDWILRLPKAAGRPLAAAGRNLAQAADGVRRLDPQRLLARGYTITADAGGRPLRSAAQLRPGDPITTTFKDGLARSIVRQTQTQTDAGAAGGREPEKEEALGGKEKDTGQQTLFQ